MCAPTRSRWRYTSAERAARRRYLFSLALVAAGLLLASVQILPTYELMRHSLRAEASYDFFSSFSLPPGFVWTFFAPFLVGGGEGALFRAPYGGAAFYGEYVGYVGLATLALAALALPLGRDARTRFWAATAVVGFLLATGRFLPLDAYRLVYSIPVLNLFRVPARHLMEVDFALAVLAGRALTQLPRAREHARTRTAIWATAACVALFALAWLAVTAGRPAWFAWAAKRLSRCCARRSCLCR